MRRFRSVPWLQVSLKGVSVVLVAAIVSWGTTAALAGKAKSPPAARAAAGVGILHNYKLPKIQKAKKHFKVILLQAHRTDAWAKSTALTMQRFGQRYGLAMTVEDAGGYQNVDKQISQIETAITEKPDAIIFWSTDPTAVVPALRKAQAAGIKIIAFAQPPNMPVSFTVTGDFVLDGRTMATALFNRIGGKGDVMAIYGGAGSAYQAALHTGFKQALAKFPNIKVIADNTIPDFDPSKITSAVEDELVRDPNLRGVATSTTAMAVGAMDAVQHAGKLGKAFAVGEIVGDCGQITLLKQGKLPIVLGVPAVYYGRLTIAYTIRFLEHQHVPKLTVIPGNVYTPKNINKAPLRLEIAPEFLKGCA